MRTWHVQLTLEAANDNDWVEGMWEEMHRLDRPATSYSAGYHHRKPFTVEYISKKPERWGRVLPFNG